MRPGVKIDRGYHIVNRMFRMHRPTNPETNRVGHAAKAEPYCDRVTGFGARVGEGTGEYLVNTRDVILGRRCTQY